MQTEIQVSMLKTEKTLVYYLCNTPLTFFTRVKKNFTACMRVYPKVSGLAAWSENCKWYSLLPLGAVVLLFCESV
jgi:hypothetical protein